MAVYTTELRRLIENGYDLGLDDYPIFDEEYRAVLNKKIIDANKYNTTKKKNIDGLIIFTLI